MKKKKALLSIITALTFALCTVSCGEKEEVPSMNYERPVRTLALAMQAYDESGYLACFTSPAAETFTNDKEYKQDFIRTLYPETTGDQNLTLAILSHEELDDKAIEKLEKEYTKQFSRRIKITKAENLQVRFKLHQKNLKRTDVKDITVVRVNNTWYIYGGVINDFDFVADTGIFSDIIRGATGDLEVDDE